MYKRKRLYDQRDSYRDTGIPCGNPKRVHTGEVLCMPNTSLGSAAATQSGESSTMTQGEEQLRVMARKQLNTKITMQELTSQRRQFSEAGHYKPTLKEVRGVLKLSDYESLAKGDERVEKLRQCGLTDDEIHLQLSREGGVLNGQNSVGTNSRSTYGTNPDIEQAQLLAIDSKIRDKEASLALPDSFRGLKQISRQEMDIEKSMFQGTSRENNTLTSLLTEKRTDVTGDPNDPINHLPQLMADIEERAHEKIREKRRRRRRYQKHKNKTDFGDSTNCDDLQELDSNDDDKDCVIGCLTFEEMQALKQSEKSSNNDAVTSDSETNSISQFSASNKACIHGPDNSHGGGSCVDSTKERCVKEISVFSRSADRKVLTGPVEFLPVEYIHENQLSLEKIKELPKFANYEAGTPSNVLFVKNLSSCCSETDLVSLFGRFQEGSKSQIVYRLMTGRMKGQAFVSFHNTDVATQAMLLVNGFVLHGKPIIVQYGRRTVA